MVQIAFDQVVVWITAEDFMRNNSDELLNKAEEHFIDMTKDENSGLILAGAGYTLRRIDGYRNLPKGWEIGDSDYYTHANLRFVVDHLPTQAEVDRVKAELHKLFNAEEG